MLYVPVFHGLILVLTKPRWIEEQRVRDTQTRLNPGVPCLINQHMVFYGPTTKATFIFYHLIIVLINLWCLFFHRLVIKYNMAQNLSPSPRANKFFREKKIYILIIVASTKLCFCFLQLLDKNLSTLGARKNDNYTHPPPNSAPYIYIYCTGPYFSDWF